jgi:hypothetical protein
MKKLLVLLLALVMVLSCTAFAEDITIAIVSQNQGNPVFYDLEVGARETAEKLGINFEWYAPETADSIKEAELIEAAANAGAQGIGVVPLDVTLTTTMEMVAKQGVKGMFSNPRLYIFHSIKLIGVPVIIALIAKVATLGMADSYNVILFCTVISSLPSAASITMLAEIYDINPEYAAQAVGSSSLISIGTLPLLYFIGDLIAKL